VNIWEEGSASIYVINSRAYWSYFGMKLGGSRLPYAVHRMCRKCAETLRLWTPGKAKAVRFGVPRVWRKPPRRLLFLYGGQWRPCVIESVGRPVPHRSEVTVYVFSSQPDLVSNDSLFEATEETDSGCSDYTVISIYAAASLQTTDQTHLSKNVWIVLQQEKSWKLG